jgi:hypothetical protein
MDVFVNDDGRHLNFSVTTEFDSWYENKYLAIRAWEAIFYNCGVSATGGRTWKVKNILPPWIRLVPDRVLLIYERYSIAAYSGR